MRKIIQMVASVGILAASMAHAAPSFAVMAPPDNSSKTRDIVLDPFGGSGTTVIACEKSGRRARLMELDPKYVDVIVCRWQDYAGKKATRQVDGARFSDLVKPELSGA